REAVDEAAIAAEHHLLVEGLAATISRQDKPGASQRTVVNGEVRVGVALHVILVTLNRHTVFIRKGPNQQFGLTVGTGEDGAVSRLRRSLGGKSIGRVLEAKSIPLVAITGPGCRTFPRNGLSDREGREQRRQQDMNEPHGLAPNTESRRSR